MPHLLDHHTIDGHTPLFYNFITLAPRSHAGMRQITIQTHIIFRFVIDYGFLFFFFFLFIAAKWAFIILIHIFSLDVRY